MKLITLSGGLGNQMFQYAFYLSLAHRHRHVYLTRQKMLRIRDHNGYELQRVFGIEMPPDVRRMDAMTCSPVAGKVVCHALFPLKYRERLQYNPTANQKVFCPTPIGTRYVGYWQSEGYFRDVKQQVLDAFCFDEARISERTRSLAADIRSNPTRFAAVHVRLGDYRKYPDLNSICTPEYYREALQRFLQERPDTRLLLFSDEPEAAKQMLNREADVIDWNHAENSWQDMYLMSLCGGMVMANSSFSWWGAYLNPHPQKLVYLPSLWNVRETSPEVAAEGLHAI